MREREASYNTQHTTADRFAQFAKQLQERSGVRDLRWISRTHIEAYADSLVCKVSDGELKLNTAVNYLSAVNTVLEQARGDRMLWFVPQTILSAISSICQITCSEL